MSRPASRPSWLDRRETAGGQGGLNLAPVTGITCNPAALAVVEISQESVSVPDGTFPACQVDRLRQHADRLRRELLTPLGEYVGGIERSVTASIIDDVTPHLQHPEATYQRFVDRTVGHLCQVVHVTAQCGSSVACQLFGASLGFGNHR